VIQAFSFPVIPNCPNDIPLHISAENLYKKVKTSIRELNF